VNHRKKPSRVYKNISFPKNKKGVLIGTRKIRETLDSLLEFNEFPLKLKKTESIFLKALTLEVLGFYLRNHFLRRNSKDDILDPYIKKQWDRTNLLEQDFYKDWLKNFSNEIVQENEDVDEFEEELINIPEEIQYNSDFCEPPEGHTNNVHVQLERKKRLLSMYIWDVDIESCDYAICHSAYQLFSSRFFKDTAEWNTDFYRITQYIYRKNQDGEDVLELKTVNAQWDQEQYGIISLNKNFSNRKQRVIEFFSEPHYVNPPLVVFKRRLELSKAEKIKMDNILVNPAQSTK